MPIELKNVYSTRNLGDAAIYAALIAMCPDNKAVCKLEEDEPTRVEGLTRNKKANDKIASVGVGGDIFNNGRPSLVTRKFLELSGELSKDNEHTFVFGQSLPPSCRGLALRYLANVFKSLSSITVRDEQSVAKLRKHGLNPHLSFDTAFVLQPDEAHKQAAREMLEREGLQAERTAVVSLRGGSPHYGADTDSIIRELAFVVQELAARGHQTALILQADCNEADTDRHMCEALVSELPFLRVLNPFEAERSGLEAWQLLQALLGEVNIAVAVRYHTAVLRMAAGKTPYVLHYSNKGEDLCNRLRQPGARLTGSTAEIDIRAIERTAGGSFDPALLAADVRQHFSAALQEAA